MKNKKEKKIKSRAVSRVGIKKSAQKKSASNVRAIVKQPKQKVGSKIVGSKATKKEGNECKGRAPNFKGKERGFITYDEILKRISND
jgi:hypothetical protein